MEAEALVAHDALLPAAHRLAATIAGNEQDAVRALLASYREIEAAAQGDGDAPVGLNTGAIPQISDNGNHNDAAAAGSTSAATEGTAEGRP